jgi:hypothetical protein
VEFRNRSHAPVVLAHRFPCVALVRYRARRLSGSRTVSAPRRQHQYDLSMEGRAFLLKEAESASFFMLGELHGENEIPALIREIWPPMWQTGYRHIAAEISPCAANRLEFRPHGAAEPIRTLWSQAEATFVASFNKGPGSVLWGCDMEEAQPHLLIRDLAAANPKNQAVQSAAEMTKSSYRRSMAPELLQQLQKAIGIKDLLIGGLSLRTSGARGCSGHPGKYPAGHPPSKSCGSGQISDADGWLHNCRKRKACP